MKPLEPLEASRLRPEPACFRRRPDELLGCSEDGCLPPEFSHDWIFGMIQVLILMAGYGYLLFYASNMLSEGKAAWSKCHLAGPALAPCAAAGRAWWL